MSKTNKSKTQFFNKSQAKAAARAQRLQKQAKSAKTKDRGKRMKQNKKYGAPETEATKKRRDIIKGVSANVAQVGADVTANIQGIEAQKTQRQREANNAYYKYLSAIGGNVGQTGDVQTGDNPTKTDGTKPSDPETVTNFY